MIETKPTFCRICEPLCGMIATVDDGRLISLRPDKDHPLSSGFACQKGIAFTEVVNDPDRVTTPLRRGPNGFEPVSWDEAMTDIAARLTDILRRDGSGAIGWYMGNPAAFSYSHLFAAMGFIKGVGRHSHYFTASSQDTSNRLAASQFLYGGPMAVPIPDLVRTDLLVMMGANPVVSHGSFLTAPRIKDRMHDIVKRGGRVVVIDPRKTETAAQFEWLGIVPDGDAYFLLSLLQVMFADGLVDRGRVESQADGVNWLERQSMPFTPEFTAPLTGIEPATVRALAHDLAETPRAAVYGRFGTCVGQNGTLTAYLIDAVNLVAGTLDRPGGSVFSTLGMPGQRAVFKVMGAGARRAYRRKRSRVGGFRPVAAAEPAALMAKEITTPGDRQIKALFTSAGNPVLSVPNGDELEAAVAGLDLMVGLDLYVNETTAHCDYVLPVTTMYERDDFAVTFQTFQATPFRQATEAVVAPVGQARTEWAIVDELTKRMAGRTPIFAAMGIHAENRGPVRQALHAAPGRRRDDPDVRGRGPVRSSPRRPDVSSGLLSSIRTAWSSRRTFGRACWARWWSTAGAVSDSNTTTSPTRSADCRGAADPMDFPMRLIGMREPRSENSWMHNAPLLMRGTRIHRALMHLDDAACRQIADGDEVSVRSPYGQIALPVALTADIVPGTIAVPHGWGHKGTGGWKLANSAGGANVNQLMSSDPDDVEALAGMSWLTGVPVEVARA